MRNLIFKNGFIVAIIFLFLGGCSSANCDKVSGDYTAAMECSSEQFKAMECDSVIALGSNIEMEKAFSSCNWPTEKDSKSCKDEITASGFPTKLTQFLQTVLSKQISCGTS